jgi:negative regulator of sigma E activity
MQTPFEKRAQELLEESTSRLDGRTLSKLTQARHAALGQLERKKSPAWWRIAVPAGATAAAVLAVFVFNRPVAAPDIVARGGDTAVEDMDLIADAPEVVDDGEDLEFYEWAAGEMES